MKKKGLVDTLKNSLLKYFCLLGVVIFAFLALYSFFATYRMYTGSLELHFKYDNILTKLLYGVFVFGLCRMLYGTEKFLTNKRIHMAAIAVSCLVAIFCIFLTEEAKSIPIDDQFEVYAAAEGLFYGDYSYMQDQKYYLAWPHQFGVAQIYVILARAVGGLRYEVLRYVQSACVGISVYFLFLIAKELFKNKMTQCLCLLFSTFFVPMLLYSQLLYGESIGLCMCLLCIWLFLLENRGGRSACFFAG